MDTVPDADTVQEYSTAKTYVVTKSATEADAREAAVLEFRDDVEYLHLIKNLEAFVRPHPKGYEVAVVAKVSD